MSQTGEAKRPVGRPRADGRPPITREAVFEVTARLIASHGYAGTSLRMIAAELGASAPSISQMFGAKHQLLNELVRTMAGVSIAFHEKLASMELQPEVRLYKMVFEEVLAVSSANESMISLFYLPELRQNEFSAAQQARDDMMGFYRETLTRGISSGVFREVNPAIATEQVFQLTETAIIARSPRKLGAPASMAADTAELVLRALLDRPSRLPRIAASARRVNLQMLPSA